MTRVPVTVVAYMTKDGGLRLKEKGSNEAWIQSDVTMEVRR